MDQDKGDVTAQDMNFLTCVWFSEKFTGPTWEETFTLMVRPLGACTGQSLTMGLNVVSFPMTHLSPEILRYLNCVRKEREQLEDNYEEKVRNEQGERERERKKRVNKRKHE